MLKSIIHVLDLLQPWVDASYRSDGRVCTRVVGHGPFILEEDIEVVRRDVLARKKQKAVGNIDAQAAPSHLG